MLYMEMNLNMPLNDVLARIQDRIINGTSYFGVRTLKCPLDFWVYQEIMFETQPDVIIEIGNFNGGSALALAHTCDQLEKGRVIGLDLSHNTIPEIVRRHPRITLIEGDACQNVHQVAARLNDTDRVMIIEDSAHTYDNTLNVLRTFSPLVQPGGYFIVEDGICHHGLDVGPNPGPYEAIETFLKEDTSFTADRSRESFFVTWNPKGYLKKLDLISS